MDEQVLPKDSENFVAIAIADWLAGAPVPTRAELFERWGRVFRNYRFCWADKERDIIPPSETYIQLRQWRDAVIKKYGFAIPSQELIDIAARHAPLIEIGAGSGYLTALLRRHGIDIIGADPALAYTVLAHGQYDPQQIKLAGKTAVRRFRDRTVFCSWPSLNHTWFHQALKAMRIGQTLIVIREDACADESAWEYLDECFVETAVIELPCWPYLNDYCHVLIKKRQQRNG